MIWEDNKTIEVGVNISVGGSNAAFVFPDTDLSFIILSLPDSANPWQGATPRGNARFFFSTYVDHKPALVVPAKMPPALEGKQLMYCGPAMLTDFFPVDNPLFIQRWDHVQLVRRTHSGPEPGENPWWDVDGGRKPALDPGYYARIHTPKFAFSFDMPGFWTPFPQIMSGDPFTAIHYNGNEFMSWWVSRGMEISLPFGMSPVVVFPTDVVGHAHWSAVAKLKMTFNAVGGNVLMATAASTWYDTYVEPVAPHTLEKNRTWDALPEPVLPTSDEFPDVITYRDELLEFFGRDLFLPRRQRNYRSFTEPEWR